VRRREFITLLGGAAAWPVASGAQQPVMPVIGWLSPTGADDGANFVTPFRKGLDETGFVEGQNLAIDYRWAAGQFDRLPALAADLVRRQVAVIAAVNGNVSALAAKTATTSIPIVFGIGGDPVALGLVASFNRPGGNITGVSWQSIELEAKRLGLLHELVPGVSVIAYLMNPDNPAADSQSKDVQSAARTLGLQVHILSASAESSIEVAFGTLVQQRAGALLVGAGPLVSSRRKQIVELAARHSVPTVYSTRSSVTVGGLMSYSPSVVDAHRQVGIYTGKILKGAKPADLPIMQTTKFEFVINLATAKALGLQFPPSLLARADEVIE
jgi:putative ABC transport system substrate-binding protein